MAIPINVSGAPTTPSIFPIRRFFLPSLIFPFFFFFFVSTLSSGVNWTRWEPLQSLSGSKWQSGREARASKALLLARRGGGFLCPSTATIWDIAGGRVCAHTRVCPRVSRVSARPSRVHPRIERNNRAAVWVREHEAKNSFARVATNHGGGGVDEGRGRREAEEGVELQYSFAGGGHRKACLA